MQCKQKIAGAKKEKRKNKRVFVLLYDISTRSHAAD
jgi:hypothetical protein